MNILVVQCFDSPRGQSNRSYIFARELNKIGHELTYYTNSYNHLDGLVDKSNLNVDNSINHIFCDNVKFKKSKSLSVLFNSVSLIKIIKKKNFDIILSPSVPLLNSFIALIFKKRNTKFIFEIRDVWPDALFFNNKLSKLNPIYLFLKCMEIIIYKKSDGIISALPKTKNYVKKYNHIIPQFYLPNCYVPYPNYEKKFKGNETSIVYIGRLNKGNDLDIILKSANYILNEIKLTNITFDIYGYGEKLNYIKKFKDQKNLTNLNIKGKIEKSYIYNTLKKYDLAICAIDNSKIFQWGINLNKLYEYFNSSMPIIFSGNVPTNPVLSANCGLICNDFNFLTLSKKIIYFSNLNSKEKLEFSKNSKLFFDKNYNVLSQTKELEKFLVSI